MLGRGLRVWEEAVGQAIDLAGIEHAVGFLEAEDAGFLGAIIAIAAVVLAARVFPALAVIDDDRGFLALADLCVQRIGLRQSHPEGRAVARHHGPHRQQEVVHPLVGFAAHAQGRELPPAVQGLRHGRTPRSMMRMISFVMTSEASNLVVRDRAMAGLLSSFGEREW